MSAITITLDDAALDALADKLAARLRGRDAGPTHYSSDAPPGGVTARAFLDACRSGDLVASKVGRRWIATAADVEAWIASRRVSRGPVATPTATRPVSLAGWRRVSR